MASNAGMLVSIFTIYTFLFLIIGMINTDLTFGSTDVTASGGLATSESYAPFTIPFIPISRIEISGFLGVLTGTAYILGAVFNAIIGVINVLIVVLQLFAVGITFTITGLPAWATTLVLLPLAIGVIRAIFPG